MYLIISPFSQSFDDIGFTYKLPSDLENIVKKGMIVKVQIGNKETYGVVLDIVKTTDLKEDKIKEICALYSTDVFLNDYQIELLKWISKYYFSLIHSSTSLFFPKNLIGKIIKNKFFFNKEIKELNYTFNYNKSLNKNQKLVFDTVISSKKNNFLLYGVTGSGKTEIYINLIKHYLDLGKQSLLLVPEIILTNQIFERIKSVFGPEVLVINSTIREAKKTLYWEQIHQNKAKIIIGTRSALFYPYNNLGIIIIDEEHDDSYISDITPRYDATKVALKITELNKNKLLLGSGTPKISHFYDFLKSTDKEILNLFTEY